MSISKRVKRWEVTVFVLTCYRPKQKLWRDQIKENRSLSPWGWIVPILKIGTPGVHVSTAGESEMCYSLGTSVGDTTRLTVTNIVRFSLYIDLIWKFLMLYFSDNCEESWVSCKRKNITIYNQRGDIREIDNNIFAEVGIEYQRQCEKVL